VDREVEGGKRRCGGRKPVKEMKEEVIGRAMSGDREE